MRLKLVEQTQALSEYELMRWLSDRGAFAKLPESSAQLSLFRKHFLIMHGLYLLQTQWAEKQILLSISPTAIECRPMEEATQSALQSQSDQPMRAFYLDLSHLLSATDETVATLLQQFWRKWDAWQRGDEDLQVLGLDASADWAAVQEAYRRQAQSLHPDKGGDPDAFRRLQFAYQQLKLKFGK